VRGGESSCRHATPPRCPPSTFPYIPDSFGEIGNNGVIDSNRAAPERPVDRARTRHATLTPETSNMERLPDHTPGPDLTPGTSIEIRGHFRGEWSRGFEVAETTHDGYWVRRLSDRYLLPVQFLSHDVRPVR